MKNSLLHHSSVKGTFPHLQLWGASETRAGREVYEVTDSAFSGIATGISIRLVEAEFATARVKVSMLQIF